MGVTDILYKFRSLSGESFKFTQDIFLRNRVFLSPVAKLNDPCEAKFNYVTPQSTSPNPYKGWAQELDRSELFGAARVFCVTESPTNALMWAHYADSHRGICIGFRSSSPALLACAKKVAYSSTVPSVDFDQNRQRAKESVALTKSRDWAYEHEWRILSTDSTAHSNGFMPIDKDDISEVIFGAHISGSDRDWVLDWVKLYNSSTRLFEARFSASGYDMEITPFTK